MFDKMVTAIKRVYCLYRVSTLGQVEKDDIPMQKQFSREVVQQQTGREIVKEFSEKVFPDSRSQPRIGTLFRKSSGTPYRTSLMCYWYSCLTAWGAERTKRHSL